MKGVVIVSRMKIGGICAKYALLWWRKKLDREFAQFVIFPAELVFIFFKTILQYLLMMMVVMLVLLVIARVVMMGLMINRVR